MWTDGSSCNKGLGSCEKLSHLLPIKLTHQDPDTSFPTQGIGERRKERGGEGRGREEDRQGRREQNRPLPHSPLTPPPC